MQKRTRVDERSYKLKVTFERWVLTPVWKVLGAFLLSVGRDFHRNVQTLQHRK